MKRKQGEACGGALPYCWRWCWPCHWDGSGRGPMRDGQLIPVGKAVGIKLFADGVLVVSVSPVQGTEETRSPAKECGLKEGDILLTFNGEKIRSTEHLQAMLAENGETAAELTVQRDGKTLEVTASPVVCEDGGIRLGAWIRDSMAGVGTLTYYDPATGSYGALGHGITDVDTAELMPLASGSIMETMVKAVKKGQRGDPGELKGDFTVQRDVGTVTVNSNEGIFGTVEDAGFISGEAVSVAEPEEVHAGEASILCTISGSDTRAYEVEILRVNPRSPGRPGSAAAGDGPGAAGDHWRHRAGDERQPHFAGRTVGGSCDSCAGGKPGGGIRYLPGEYADHGGISAL